MAVFRTAPRVERRGAWPEQQLSQLIPRRDSVPAAFRARDGLEVAAVVACVGLRAGAFAQLPLRAYRERGGVPEQVTPQPPLFASPSDTVVPSIWKTQMSISRDLWGFSLGQITAFDAALYPTKVTWLDPSIVTPTVTGHHVEWRVAGSGELDPSTLLHIPSRWVMPGNPVGISPLEASGLVELARRAQDFGRDWFRYGSVPSAILYSDQALTQEQADGIVDRIMSKWRVRKPAVLGAGLRYEAQSVNADESQFLETMTRVAHDIAISFNLPPEKIGAAISGSAVTYANREQNQQQYLIDSINPDLVVIQESMDRVTPRGMYAKFNTAAFLRSDLTTRYTAYEVGIRSGFLTVNEARAHEELEPLTTPAPGGAE